jgi:hypothetical protein
MAATKWHDALLVAGDAAQRQESKGVLLDREVLQTLVEAAKVGANAIGYEYMRYTEPDMHAAEMLYRAFREGSHSVAREAAKEWSRKHRPIAALD